MNKCADCGVEIEPAEPLPADAYILCLTCMVEREKDLIEIYAD